MALIQISEPGQAPEPHERRQAVGIDLGTTNSLVAAVRSSGPEVLSDEQGKTLVPSIVNYGENGIVFTGDSARQRSVSDPLNTLISTKRMLGRDMNDLDGLGLHLPYDFDKHDGGMPLIKTRIGLVSPIQASAEILGAMAMRAEKALGSQLDGAVITVPAYFDDAQRQATKDAASLAGIRVLRLLNEPTAAAIAYGLEKADEGIIAVYDLGGGTFDISILKLSRGVFQVLATGGDSALGGDDFDILIADWILGELQIDSVLDPHKRRELIEVACEAKVALTKLDMVDVSFSGWSGKLTREAMEKLIKPLMEKTLRSCRRTLRDAGLKSDEVNDVVLVGGPTRMPIVQHDVSEFFGRQALSAINPDHVVALGAALQAEILVGNQSTDNLLLLDVLPLSLGVETMGGLVEKIIHRNTTIPVSRAQDFTTFKDGQTAMVIHVMQGERELSNDCRSLARFTLKDIPSMTAGAAKIRVTYQVDADGLLSVSARDMVSAVEASIEVKPSYGLAESDITEMLKDSQKNSRADVAARALREQQVDADRMIEDLGSALRHDADLLDTSEVEKLRALMFELKDMRASCTDHRLLSEKIKEVGEASEFFAAKRMNASIKSALVGRDLDEME
ncbi:MAG: Fe-S protein assembly chaperone HscA [Porticoccaceae bacterium]|nr:Fe-S protein assembly chaperone HscA [Porticoccaceae bacterium]